MTKIEAIEWLKSIKDKYISGGDEWYDQRRRQAIDYAIDMLNNSDVESARGHWEYGNGYQDGKADAMASIVRCKDCKHRGDDVHCPMCYEEVSEYDDGDGYMEVDYIPHDRTWDDGFCDRSERRWQE